MAAISGTPTSSTFIQLVAAIVVAGIGITGFLKKLPGLNRPLLTFLTTAVIPGLLPGAYAGIADSHFVGHHLWREFSFIL